MEVEESAAEAAVTAAQGRDGQASDEAETSTEMRPGRGENSAGTAAEGTDMAAGTRPERGEEGGTSTVTTYIPVGVTVHTASDNETTFSRLAAGDLLKILVENDDDGEQVIVEIWMLL